MTTSPSTSPSTGPATYAVLLPDHEDRWERATPDERRATYARHEEFSRRLAERGHEVVSGAELVPSREARTVRAGAGGALSITEGPYAETAEQLSGFYLVRSSDLDDLLQVCGVLAVDAEGRGSGVEVRRTVDHGAEGEGSA